MKATKMLAILVLALGLIVCQAKVGEAAPMGTAWTYQGRLMDVNEAADGLYDFEFRLYDSNDPCTGTQQGSTIDINDLDVIDGSFTVELDFGSDVFNGEARWLEIGVRPGDSNDANDFVTLSPWTELTPTPYAIYAKSAGGDNDWMVSGNDMYSIPSGNVGIGTINPTYPLHVVNPADSSYASAIYGLASPEGVAEPIWGIYGQTNSIATTDAGAAVMGYAASTLGNSSGVRGEARGEQGKGVFALATDLAGTNYGLYARTESRRGYAGYFIGGSNYFEGNVGIGVDSPEYKLDVAGDISATGTIYGTVDNADKVDDYHASAFALAAHDHDALYVNIDGDTMFGSLKTYYYYDANYAVKGVGYSGPTTGYLGVQGSDDYDNVLSADWDGDEIGVVGISTNASDNDNYGVLGHSNWVGVRGEYSEDPNNYGELGRRFGYGVFAKGTKAGGYFLSSTNQGKGVYAKVNYSGSGLKYAGYFECDSSVGYGVYATVNGTSTTNWAVRGEGTGSGSSGGWFSTTAENRVAVYGNSTSTSGSYNTNKGGQFKAAGNNGYGVHCEASGTYGTGIYAKGGSAGYAAIFSGKVKIVGRDGGSTVMELGEGLDYAEGFDVSESTKIAEGSVLIIDADNPGKLALSDRGYDTKVAGIVAGANSMGSGVRLGAGQFDYDVALAGRVYCNVDAAEQAIQPGDLLTTSATPGYAMKAADYARSHGAILGKAMESLEKGQRGQILVLVTLQ